MALYGCDGCLELIPSEKARLHCQDCVGGHNICSNCYVIGVYTPPHTETHTSIAVVVKSGHQPKPPALPRRQEAAAIPEDIPVEVVNAQPAVRSGWQPLFQGSSPSPLMVNLLGVIFDFLDTDKDGFLSPEECTTFDNFQTYGNVKKTELPDHAEQDKADWDLNLNFEILGIEHIQQARPQASVRNYNSNLKTPTKGMRPLLTKAGFIEYATVDLLLDPPPSLNRINNCLRHFNIWREWGDVPRSMMPDVPPPDLVARVEALKANQEAKDIARAKERVRANAVRLAIQAQGEQNSLDLIGYGRRYR